MKALITGASSGIGMEIAKYLAKQKCELILVARDKKKLEELQQGLPTKTTIITLDLSNEQKVKELYVLTKNAKIDILINNAGFGKCGNFDELSLIDDTDMIAEDGCQDKLLDKSNVNIKAVHVLTKSFLKDMIKRNSGYILNVSSSAAFPPGGPLMATYYATKSYIYSLTVAISYELKRRKSKKKRIRIWKATRKYKKTNRIYR